MSAPLAPSPRTPLRYRVRGLTVATLLLATAGWTPACATRQPVDTVEAPAAVAEDLVEVSRPVVEIRPVKMTPAPAEGRLPPSDAEPSPGRQLSALIPGDVRMGRTRRVEHDARDRVSSLLDRRKHRAFQGAPPVMGHSMLFVQGSMECLDCHRDGMTLGSRVARPMSHVELANCTQCHIEPAHVEFGPGEVPTTNGFEGLTNRIPPGIPHAASLREDCRSCHAEQMVEPSPGLHVLAGRAHPGAPAVMPHADYEEGGRDCLICHVPGEPTVRLLSHPVGSVALQDCTSCHLDEPHEAFGNQVPDPGRWSRQDCAWCHGPFDSPDPTLQAQEHATRPPRLPHETFLRGRCLSCHGDLGYPGLQIDHPERTQCLQCHITADEQLSAGFR